MDGLCLFTLTLQHDLNLKISEQQKTTAALFWELHFFAGKPHFV